MAVKNYGIRDQWTNIDTLNNVDIKSVDGVIESVKINGEEAGGGSSDFSTAEVVVNNYATSGLFMPYLDGDKMKSKSALSGTYTVPLYKGEVYVTSEYGGNEEAFTAISGNVAYDSATQYFKITGDCTLQLGYLKPTP